MTHSNVSSRLSVASFCFPFRFQYNLSEEKSIQTIG